MVLFTRKRAAQHCAAKPELPRSAIGPARRPLNLISRYPGGFAWPAHDDRFGRYIMCPIKSDAPFEMGVVDDYGNLVRVPSIGLQSTVHPTVGLLA